MVHHFYLACEGQFYCGSHNAIKPWIFASLLISPFVLWIVLWTASRITGRHRQKG
jgi:hypothetical protein